MTTAKEDNSSQSESIRNKKPPVWIRPGHVAMDLHKLEPYTGSSPNHGHQKNLARLAIDLTGVAILCIAIWFITMQTIQALSPQSAPGKCNSSADHCNQQSLSPAVVPSNTIQTPTVGSQVIPTVGVVSPTPQPTSVPTRIQTPTPQPTPSPTPTPIPTPTPQPEVAILNVTPSSLTISYASSCDSSEQPVHILLENVGSIVLIWHQDTVYTSQGLRLRDPRRLYLIQPGQSMNTNFYCTGIRSPGQYQLQIDYNGGALDIPVLITN